MFAKLLATALAPLWMLTGIAGALLGWCYQSLWAVSIGLPGALLMLIYILRITRDHKDFERAFGKEWMDKILPQQLQLMVKRRWSPCISLKASPAPRWERDVPFWTIPDSERQLLCDVWSPADGKTSGLAFIFFHGSAWFVGDKDMLTRPMFRHLVAQGHTVMDVAYRLCPEVNIFDMVGDIKRSIAWMKANANRYGVNPDKVVLAGGSAGGHLALLAAYTPDHPQLGAADLKGTDLSVCGVVSYYGPTDMLAEYKRYMWKAYYSKMPPLPIGSTGPIKMSENLYVGRLDMLLGGHPDEVPEIYQLTSPISHVKSGCPPTLLIQGEKDLLVPVEATRALYTKLCEAGVPAINIIFPWTDHAFDLAVPQINPPAQSGLYSVDRFLALMLNSD
jgi:acetyl esterase/lipase